MRAGGCAAIDHRCPCFEWARVPRVPRRHESRARQDALCRGRRGRCADAGGDDHGNDGDQAPELRCAGMIASAPCHARHIPSPDSLRRTSMARATRGSQSAGRHLYCPARSPADSEPIGLGAGRQLGSMSNERPVRLGQRCQSTNGPLRAWSTSPTCWHCKTKSHQRRWLLPLQLWRRRASRSVSALRSVWALVSPLARWSYWGPESRTKLAATRRSRHGPTDRLCRPEPGPG